jgi:hypothetical protein
MTREQEDDMAEAASMPERCQGMSWGVVRMLVIVVRILLRIESRLLSGN